MARLLMVLLRPFSWLYAGVAAVRNWLYDVGWKKSETFAVPLINVGNLRVGGTGKTPHVIWLVEELLRLGHRPAILSRGYGRQTTGPRLAGPQDSAATIGDEPWQYVGQFGGRRVPVAVAEKRRLGVPLLLAAHPETSVIVLDDAYQHRAVRPALNMLLTEYARPFYEDFVLPAGRLRESRAGAWRADVVVVTKCPVRLAGSEYFQEYALANLAKHIRPYTKPNVPILLSLYDYGVPKDVNGSEGSTNPLKKPVKSAAAPALLLTGIAQPGPLREYLKNQGYDIQYHANFPDHHPFTPEDLTALRAHWQPGWPIFTTEKDATRLLVPALRAALAGLPLYTIPVRVAFLGTSGAALRRLLPRPPAPRA